VTYNSNPPNTFRASKPRFPPQKPVVLMWTILTSGTSRGTNCRQPVKSPSVRTVEYSEFTMRIVVTKYQTTLNSTDHSRTAKMIFHHPRGDLRSANAQFLQEALNALNGPGRAHNFEERIAERWRGIVDARFRREIADNHQTVDANIFAWSPSAWSQDCATLSASTRAAA
jgi:hypothetical protein